MKPLPLLSVIALLSVLAPTIEAQKAVAVPRFGFEIKPPKGWTQLPADGDRGQCVLFFVGPRALSSKTRGTHTPTMRVLFFPEGLGEEDEVDGLPRTTPYRDLDDYVERGHGDQAKFTTREAEDFGDFQGRRFIVEVSNNAGRRTLLGAALPLEDGELVVEFEILSDQFGKERKGYERVLASLGKIERDASASGSVTPPWKSDPAAWKAMDAAERSAAQRKFAEDLEIAAPDAPGVGWKFYKSKYWTVVSATDASFTKKAITAAEAARKWCAQHLSGTGNTEPMRAVLRIFESPHHYRAFKLRVTDRRDYSPDTRELYFVDDPNSGTSDGWGPLFRAVLWHWVDDHAPGSVAAMPRWIENGLWEYMRHTRLKGKKIEFSPSEVENGRFAYYRQKDMAIPAIWNLIQESMQPSPEGGENEELWGYTPECSRLMRWVFEHDGGAAFGKPDLLSECFAGLAEAHSTVGPNPTLDVDVARLTDAQAKTMNERFYAWRDSVLKTCNDRALPLAVDAWTATNEKWMKFNEDFK